MLIVDLANVDLLLPALVVTDNDFSKIVLQTEINNEAGDLVQLVIDPTGAFHYFRLSVRTFAMRLKTCGILVVQSVDALQRAPFDNHRMNPAGRRGKSDEISKPNINKASSTSIESN